MVKSWVGLLGGWVGGCGGSDGWPQTLTRDPYLNHVLPLRHSKSYRVDGTARGTASYIVAQPAIWWTTLCPSSCCPPGLGTPS